MYNQTSIGSTLGPAKEQSIAEGVLSDLEFIRTLLIDTNSSQENFTTRLFGPRPGSPDSNPVQGKQPGVMGDIAERIQQIRELAIRVRDNQDRLGVLA